MPFCTIAVPGESAPKRKVRYLRLFDVYGPLLTESRRDICNLYFVCDLSLSEIAEQKGVTKQSVSEALKTSRELLDSFEERLHVVRDDTEYSLAVSNMMTDVTRALESFARRHPEFSEEMGSIADMVCVGERIDPEKEE